MVRYNQSIVVTKTIAASQNVVLSQGHISSPDDGECHIETL